VNTDLLAYVLRSLRLAREVETITACDGNRSPMRDKQIDAAFMALLIRYAERDRGGPKRFPSATLPPNFYSAAVARHNQSHHTTGERPPSTLIAVPVI